MIYKLQNRIFSLIFMKMPHTQEITRTIWKEKLLLVMPGLVQGGWGQVSGEGSHGVCSVNDILLISLY